MRKWERIFLGIFIVLISFVASSIYELDTVYAAETKASVIAEGSCGTSVEWSLESNGRLVISGTGETNDYATGDYAPWYSYREDITEIQVLNGVTGLGSGVFFECKNASDIKLLGKIKIIGDYAFKNCTSLMYITLPSSLETIGMEAFYGCSGLGAITIPSNVTSIGKTAFGSCTRLVSVSVDARITVLEDYVFNSCPYLSSVILPKGLKSIETAVFNSCTRLSAISLPDSLETIGESAFGECFSLKKLVIPEKVVEIGNSAFGYCTELSDIELPDSLEKIGDSVFGYCSKLTSIDIPPNVKTMGMGPFMECSSLKEIEIPESVSSIGTLGFWNCTALKKVTFLKSNTVMGDYFLRGCTSLEAIYGHSDSTAETLAVNSGVPFFAFEDSSNYNVELKNENFVYNGKKQKPQININFCGEQLCEDKDYEAAYQNNIDVGTALVTINGKGRYQIKIDKEYVIAPQSIEKLIVSFEDNVIYRKKPVQPSVVIKDGDRQLVNGKDYVIDCTNNVEVGNATAIVKGKGNYSGTLKKQFRIQPAPQKINANSFSKAIKSKKFNLNATTDGDGKLTYRSSAPKVAAIDKSGNIKVKSYGKSTITIQAAASKNYKSSRKKITIKVVPKRAVIKRATAIQGRKVKLTWKVDSSVSGYHMYLSTDKNFKKDTIEKRYSKKNSGKKLLGTLEKRKTYYIKIRAYKKLKGKVYYGAWSKIKRVKIK